MPVFYDLPFALAMSCTASIGVTGVFFLLTRKRITNKFVPIMGVLQVSFVVILVAFYFLGYQLQVAVALPYIQQALDEQCGQQTLVANADGFKIDSGFWWSSGDTVDCHYNNVEWICTCLP
ncbi:MAG: hypothetical protein H7175_08110 [Burkholderiales bacterium]|nr:hypothetical protein [Anaerolineae bacterium]